MKKEDTPTQFSDVPEVLEDLRQGKMIVLVDAEDRENEGDLVCAGEKITPELINFMARFGRGLICVPLTPEKCDELALYPQTLDNTARYGTAFTVTIDAAEGITTGISAADRAHTIRVAADEQYGREVVVSPGHVFPLRAMPGGVLQRTGQTEGSVDLARLAGLTPAGVICEIMKPDGTMARMPDLEAFAEEHGLTVVSIADLIEYRLQRDRLVERVETFEIELGRERQAVFQAHVYAAVPGIKRREYVALALGEIDDGQPVPCRGHVACLADDVFGAHTRKNSPRIDAVIEALIKRGRGVVLYLPSRDTIRDELAVTPSGARPARGRRDREGEIREYGIGAQILLDLGVRRLQVISNNPHRLVGLEAWGFESSEQIRIEEV